MKSSREILKKQRAFFNEGGTLSLGVRDAALDKLYRAIKKNEDKILAALTMDLGKSATEGFMCEVGLAMSEITHMRKNLRRFAAAKRATALATTACSSRNSSSSRAILKSRFWATHTAMWCI